jgi:hypothetical protein
MIHLPTPGLRSRRSTMGLLRRLPAAALTATLFCGAALAKPVEVPFDFSRGAIGLDVTVKGVPLFVILDTGVDPSVIDINRAEALALNVDRAAGGEASGYGDAKSARVFPATIAGLAIAGRSFAPVNALAADTSAMSAGYGRRLDGVLGYSFLTDKIVLIDYRNRKIGLLDQPGDATPTIQSCHKRWALPLQFLDGDNTPIIPDFHLGAAAGPITLDTGSNGGISLFPPALDLSGVRGALVEKGEVAHSGSRGDTKSKSYALNETVGFGPFTLPAGEEVRLDAAQSPTDKRVANVGNQLFAAMKLKILLDYHAKQITFYGDCADG